MLDQRLEDRRLVSRLIAGDGEAFDEFVDVYYPRLFRFAYSRLQSDREGTEEVVQAAFANVIGSLHKYRGEASLFTWICSFCRYEIYAMWRSRSGKGEPVELTEDSPDIRAALESMSMTPSTPEADLQRKELSRLVRATLDHLPPRYGTVLELKYIARMPVRDIAERMSVSPKAAESLLTRARAAFRDGFVSINGRGREWT